MKKQILSLIAILTLSIATTALAATQEDIKKQMIASAMEGKFVGIEPKQGKGEAIRIYNEAIETYKKGQFRNAGYSFNNAYTMYDNSLIEAAHASSISFIQDKTDIKYNISKLQALADKGFIPAMLNLAIIYERGIRVDKNYDKALEILEKIPNGEIDASEYIAQVKAEIEEVRLAAERKAEQERVAAELRAKEEAERAEQARIEAEQRAKEEAIRAKAAEERRVIEQAQAQERVEKLRTELKVKPVKSIDDGFRGIPWGIKKEDAIPLFGLYEHELGKMTGAKLYGREGENLSLGNIPLLSLVYLFGVDAGVTEDSRKGFIGVLLQFESKYFKPAIQEVTNMFGKPTLTSGLTGEWHLKTVKITMKMSFDNPAASIQITRQLPEQQQQKGGGF